MKRTLLITAFYPPRIGGIEHYLSAFVQLFPSTVFVCTPPWKGADAHDRAQPAIVLREPLFPWRGFRPSWLPLLWRIPPVIRHYRIEQILFGHYAQYALIGPYLFKRFGIPFYCMFHGVDALVSLKRRFSHAQFRWTLRRASGVIANSRFTAAIAENAGVSRDRITIGYPSVWSVHPPRDDRFRQDPSIAKRPILLTVCRLVPRKGIDTVLQVLPTLLKDTPNLLYVIVGDGPDRERLLALSRSLGVGHAVRFIGAIPDSPDAKAPFYTACDVFVMPTSQREGGLDVESFGIVYLEAMAYGKPVVASTNGGAREIVDNGVNGFLVPDGKTETLVDCVRRLLNSATLRERLGSAGREKVRQKFLWERQKPLFEQALG